MHITFPEVSKLHREVEEHARRKPSETIYVMNEAGEVLDELYDSLISPMDKCHDAPSNETVTSEFDISAGLIPNLDVSAGLIPNPDVSLGLIPCEESNSQCVKSPL